MAKTKQGKPPKEFAFNRFMDGDNKTLNETSQFPDFNKMVKAFLAEKGKTMIELAEHLNMTRQGLYNHLNSSNPNIYIVRLIAEYLEASVNEILGDPAFEGGGNIYTSPEFYNLKNRICLYAEKRALSLDDIAEHINALYNDPMDGKQLTSYLIELESFEYKDAPNNYISILIFINNILKILEIDFYNFFFLNRNKAESAVIKAVGVVESQKTITEDISLNIPVLLKSLSKELSSRAEVMIEVIDYFIQKYPEDKISEFLEGVSSHDAISKNSNTYVALKRIIKSELKFKQKMQ